MKYKKNAFSLVELSIVLVILSLLIVSVTTGQKLISNAKINKIINEIQQIKASVNTFELTYDYLPGDFISASELWQDELGNPITIDGDGDGLISNSEKFYVFSHLERAELLSGQKTTSDSTAQIDRLPIFSYKFIANSNLRAQIVNPEDLQETANHTTYGINLTNISGNIIQAGYYDAPNIITDGVAPYRKGLTAFQASKIDKKLDDSVPTTGNIMSTVLDDFTCYDHIVEKYMLKNDGITCNLLFKLNN